MFSRSTLAGTLLIGASLLGQSVATSMQIDLAGLFTQTVAVPTGNVVQTPLTLDPGSNGGDVIDVATHDPAVEIRP
jgi:hypothetical protein